MIKTNPDALVLVRMLSSRAGGRRGPTPARSHGCLMAIDGVNLDVRLRLDRTGPLSPGDTAEVAVNFLDPAFARRHLKVGEPFRLRETTVIAEGVIKEIYAPIGDRSAA